MFAFSLIFMSNTRSIRFESILHSNWIEWSERSMQMFYGVLRLCLCTLHICFVCCMASFRSDYRHISQELSSIALKFNVHAFHCSGAIRYERVESAELCSCSWVRRLDSSADFTSICCICAEQRLIRIDRRFIRRRTRTAARCSVRFSSALFSSTPISDSCSDSKHVPPAPSSLLSSSPLAIAPLPCHWLLFLQ